MPESTFAGLAFHNIGPAMSGLADVEGIPGDRASHVGTSVACEVDQRRHH